MVGSTLQAFAHGDVFVGATVLNDPADDHAGRGRIIQYDADLVEKGVLWLEQTTHLVGGLKFDARGQLWAFDSQSFTVLVIHEGGRVERRDFEARPFSHVNFSRDGTVYLGEHIAGDTIRPEIQARLGTTLPHMPGTQRYGDGHVWHFRENGAFLREYATQTHGGMAGFLGVTHSALSPDESTLVYCSETGPRLMRYDLKHDRQLTDLQSFPDGQREMFFGMEYGPDGHLYVLRGGRMDIVARSGATIRSIPLPGTGWATMALAADGRCAFVGNFFTGELGKIDLDSGARLATTQTGGARSLVGLAVRTPPVAAAKPRRSRAVAPAQRRRAPKKRRAAVKQRPAPARRKQAVSSKRKSASRKRKAAAGRKRAAPQRAGGRPVRRQRSRRR